MKYTTLTPEQTDKWITNLDRLVSLHLVLKVAHKLADSHREECFIKHYTGLWSKFIGREFSDVFVSSDGKHYAFGVLWGKNLKKIPDYSQAEMKNISLIEGTYGTKWEDKLQRLVKNWNKYASKPFEIVGSDLEDYHNICYWHSVLKAVAIELGVYDEALDLDEDC